MGHTYADATVAFSDGTERQFDEVTVHSDGSLSGKAIRRLEITPPDGRLPDDNWISSQLAALTETVHYAPHAWLRVSPQTTSVLCVAVREPGMAFEPLAVTQIDGEITSKTDVRRVIDDWLAREVVSQGGEFRAKYPDGQQEQTGIVPLSREAALSAIYATKDNDLGEGEVRFWLLRPGDDREPETLVHL
ncbi:hypothetical protein [Mycobacteroides abscessus]|uniref:hypothetical protein n=1 Tax=Mycobacteroides abscessus TaxID=36809 RepID=UPI0012FFF83F|nr:hypothetical protein [Mycobacteroides abscessus]